MENVDKITRHIDVKSIGIAKATSRNPIIGVASLLSCAASLMYDAEQKIGGVTHVFFYEERVPRIGEVLEHTPREFSRYKNQTIELAKRMNATGANCFDFYAFNLEATLRDKQAREVLKTIARDTLEVLQLKYHLRSVHWREERDFKIDTRTGLITLFYS